MKKMKELYLENVRYLLETGVIEGCILRNVKLLNEIFNDENIVNPLYEGFYNNLEIDFAMDDLLMKVQDHVYRLDMLINDGLISICNVEIEKIKSNLKDLVNKDVDLYSAVSYDETDKLIQEEFEDLIHSKDIKII